MPTLAVGELWLVINAKYLLLCSHISFSCNTDTHALPDVFALALKHHTPSGLCIHIRQCTEACISSYIVVTHISRLPAAVEIVILISQPAVYCLIILCVTVEAAVNIPVW